MGKLNSTTGHTVEYVVNTNSTTAKPEEYLKDDDSDQWGIVKWL